ncbi:MAG: alpha/beta fold hydrolase [Gammaproteobacteria bacterium]|nr:alpha/beta fold hydrolase [Gammaproteobacteria bacterium]
MSRAPTLPVDEIQDWLGAHPGIHNVTPLSLAIAYRKFYGLDFHVDEHHMGRVPVHAERIFVQLYRRFASHLGTVFLLHGYLDHSGIQGPTIERLLDLGYDVVAIDHAGHGFSTGDRANTDTFQLYVDSVSAAEEASDTKGSLVIMGHSLGGAVAMTHMLQHPHIFRRAVLIAPLYRPKSWRMLKLLHLLGRHLIKGQPRLWRQNTRDETFGISSSTSILSRHAIYRSNGSMP